jgi:sulfur carrier protein
MLTVTVNGQEKILEKPLNLNEALTEWGYRSHAFAVAINATFVPRSRYAATLLKDGDAIDVLSPLSGG